MTEINNFFESYLKKESIFIDKKFLLPSYIPEEILYREEQLREVANILAPALRLEKPSNLFIYGKTGTGKTISIKHIIHSMNKVALLNNIPLKHIYINCKLKRVADTEYRLIAEVARELLSGFTKEELKALQEEYNDPRIEELPVTGLPTDEIYKKFYSFLDYKRSILLLVLDEIDQLTKKIGDEILYNLTRINVELRNSQICLIGISNNLIFTENLDPRIKSSLSEEEIIFSPYNALQIQDILRKRAINTFRPDVLQPGVIEKCAAYSARDHGDARRAIDLLRIASELAERAGSTIVEIGHLDEAEKKIESDKVIDAATNQPKQFQSVLFAILHLAPQKKNFFTGEIYSVYKDICKQSKLNVLTQRRVSDIIAEMDMLGIINARIISKGRYGRTRDISLSIDENLVLKLKSVLEKSLQLS